MPGFVMRFERTMLGLAICGSMIGCGFLPISHTSKAGAGVLRQPRSRHLSIQCSTAADPLAHSRITRSTVERTELTKAPICPPHGR